MMQTLERDKPLAQLQSPLRFPGKLAVDAQRRRLFIADSANNRILCAGLDGSFVFEAGGAAAGLLDGPVATAAFNKPQGLAFDAARNALYVADTENHAVRKIDLDAGVVSTLAGNGGKGRDYRGGRAGRQQQLNSPWDVALLPGTSRLAVAMSGQHQVWQLDVETGECGNFSGTGQERNQNGGDGRSTAWAQPSGLALRSDGAAMCALCAPVCWQLPCVFALQWCDGIKALCYTQPHR